MTGKRVPSFALGELMEIRFLAPPMDVPPYCWLIEIGPRRLGVHEHNGWCMQVDERIVFIDSEDRCMPLAPILELDERMFFDFLRDTEKLVPAYVESIRRFPKSLLIKHVFHTSFSGYWPEKALAWLIADKGIQPQFRDELARFIENKVMPQGARQMARRIVRGLPEQ